MPISLSLALSLVFSAASLATTVAADSSSWMSEAELRTAFTGKTISGRYAGGRPFTEHYRQDGRLEYRERGNLIDGNWSVEAGAFCTIYDRDASGGCFRVRHITNNCFEFYFVARTEEEAAAAPRAPDWTARGSIEGQRGACEEEHAV